MEMKVYTIRINITSKKSNKNKTLHVWLRKNSLKRHFSFKVNLTAFFSLDGKVGGIYRIKKITNVCNELILQMTLAYL